jgi:hypothetical protein
MCFDQGMSMLYGIGILKLNDFPMNKGAKNSLIIVLVFLATVLGIVFSLKDDVSRNNLHIYLSDGRFLNVVECSSVSDDRLEVFFASGIKSIVSKSTLNANGVSRWFTGETHHKGSVTEPRFVSVTYPVAGWFTHQPVKLIELVNAENFGVYKSDISYDLSLVKRGRRKLKPVEGVSLSDLRYYPQKRSYANFQAAIERDLPAQIVKPKINPGVDALLRIALSLDKVYSVALAEATVRYSSKSDYVQSVETLCEVYLRTGNKRQLSKFINDHETWRVSRDESDLFKTLSVTGESDLSRAWFSFQLAILSGKSNSKIESRLGEFLDVFEGANNKQKKRFIAVKKQAEAREIFHDDPFQNLNEEGKLKLRSVASRYAFQLKSLDIPLLERYALLSEEKIIDDIKLYSRVYGNMSNKMVDLILYLMEQRGYDGVDIAVSDLLWGGIHIQGEYGKKRAMPVFALAQKTAVMNPGSTHSKQILAQQFAVESGVYYCKSLKDKFYIIRNPELSLVGLEMSQKGIEIAYDDNSGTYAKRYSAENRVNYWNIKKILHNIGKLPGGLSQDEVLKGLNDASATVRMKAYGEMFTEYINSGSYEDAFKLSQSFYKKNEREDIRLYTLLSVKNLYVKKSDSAYLLFIKAKVGEIESHADSSKRKSVAFDSLKDFLVKKSVKVESI